MKSLTIIGCMAAAFAVGAADYTWLASPVSGNWLTDANWDLGAWAETATANAAIFGASSQTSVDVNGDVTAASVTVDGADYTFGGAGTLTVNGPFNVAAGHAVTVTGAVAQTSGVLTERFNKMGGGTLALTGGGSLGRIGVAAGKLELRGGTFDVTYPDGAEGQNGTMSPLIMHAENAELLVTDGATLRLFGNPRTVKATGILRIENGTVSAEGQVPFWNSSYTDSRSGQVIVGKGGRMKAYTWLNAGFSIADKVTTLVTTGGVMEVEQGLASNSGSFSSTMLFDGGTLISRNFNFSSYKTKTLVKVGPGGIYLEVPSNLQSVGGFLHSNGESDGGVHVNAHPVVYFRGTNDHKGGTWLDGANNVYLCLDGDGPLGAVPSTPTNNIFFVKSTDILVGDAANVRTHANRTVSIAPNAVAQFGVTAGSPFTIGGVLSGPTNSKVRTVHNWAGGPVVFDPGEGRVSSFGQLRVNHPTVLASGRMEMTQVRNGAETGASVPEEQKGGSLWVASGHTFSITGGVFMANKSSKYVTLQGNLAVTDGGVADLDVSSEVLNAFGVPGTTTVARAGTLICRSFRVAQSIGNPESARLHLVTGGIFIANGLYIDEGTKPHARLDFNGGMIVSRMNNGSFIGASAMWKTNVFAYVQAGGLIVSNNHNIGIGIPLRSAAEQDGGLAKYGTGTLTVSNTNTYNGATRLGGGTLAFTHAEGYPGGDLEIAAAAVQGKTLAAPLLTAQSVTFREGKGVRVTEADTLDDKTYGSMKTVATFTMPLAAVPSLTLVNTDGTEWTSSKQWHLKLVDGGKTLQFGAQRGTQLILR